jgi:DNA (cytosine-5)-methyltransferase 1
MVSSKPSDITITDQFCGAGGSSVGAEKAGGRLLLGLNHWQEAIDTHNANFPDADHDCADMSSTDPRRYRSTNFLITSPECTNHSVAKGNKRKYQKQLELFGKVEINPADERSRATMWDVVRFAEHHKYEYIVAENVIDVRYWKLYDAWIQAMRTLGYEYKEVYFNSMFAHLKPSPDLRLEKGDFAAQSRDRIYVVFWRKGNHAPDLDLRPTGYCPTCEKDHELVQSWKNLKKQWGRYGERNQYLYRCPSCAEAVTPYYYACANIIDWSIPATLIKDRKRPLKPRTISRIQDGIDKFGNQPALFTITYSNANGRNVRSLDMPMYTQTSRQELALYAPMIIPFRGTTGGHAAPIGLTEPLTTVIASGIQHGLIQAPWIFNNNQNAQPTGIDEPIHTQMAKTNQYLVAPPFLLNMLSARRGLSDVTQTLPTVTGQNHFFLINPPFVMSYYGGSNVYQEPNEALGTLTAKMRHALVEPLGNIEPEDCGFRMLEPHEVQAAQAFPANYIFTVTTKRDKVKMIGNAVTPPVMELLVSRCIAALEC